MDTAAEVQMPRGLQGVYRLIKDSNGCPDDVFEQASKLFPDINIEEIRDKGRAQDAKTSAARRAVIFALYHGGYGLNKSNVAEKVGRDHTTVIYALRKIDDEIKKANLNPQLFRKFSNLVFPQAELVLPSAQFVLGSVRTFDAPLDGINYFQDLRIGYGNFVRHGPAVDLVHRTLLPKGNEVGFYFHQRTTFPSVDSKNEDAPFFSLGKPITLEEALSFK